MARPLRIEFAGALYHVTSRGDRREDIFFDDQDRLVWLNTLGKVCQRFNWVCHAWCQMTNHYHLVIETVEPNLAQGMRLLNGVYTQHVNFLHDRVGHVFQGRYKSILVQKETYLLELARYVVLNPVRAGMVGDVAQWRWSSYASMLDSSAAPAWLQTGWILAQFSSDGDEAISKYRDFVHAGLGLPALWQRLRGQIYLGSDEFLSRMNLLTSDQAAEVPRTQRRPLAKPLAHYLAQCDSAKEAMVAAHASGQYTMQAIADAFGVHYSTVSRVVRQSEPDKMRDCKT